MGPDLHDLLQRDDVSLYDNQLENWKLKSVSDGIEGIHGWQNSKMLEANLPGLGKLTASLTYFSENLGQKEVLVLYLFFFSSLSYFSFLSAKDLILDYLKENCWLFY